MYRGIVTRISLSVCLITTVILMVMLSAVLVNFDGSYSDFIQSQAITQKNMQYAIIIAALVLLCIIALLSWLISLYASFRIAGPLYRFTHNLELHANSDKMLHIRANDQFQELSKKIISAAKNIEQHKQALSLQIENCQQLLNTHEDTKKIQQLSEQLHQLKQLESKIKLDDQA